MCHLHSRVGSQEPLIVFAMPQQSFVRSLETLERFDCAGELSVKEKERSEVNHSESDAASLDYKL